MGLEHIAKEGMSWAVPEDHHLIGILHDMSDYDYWHFWLRV